MVKQIMIGFSCMLLFLSFSHFRLLANHFFILSAGSVFFMISTTHASNAPSIMHVQAQGKAENTSQHTDCACEKNDEKSVGLPADHIDITEKTDTLTNDAIGNKIQSVVLPQHENATELQPEPSERHDLEEGASVYNIVPHKATYDISLLRVQADDDISDVKGWMTIEVIDTGDGWAVAQKSYLIVYDSAGEGEPINTTLLSWESKNGARYRFYMRTTRNGDQEDVIRGDACKSPDGKTCVVNYEHPEGLSITIPGQSIFPMNHLIAAIERGKAGRYNFSDIVFDGSSETHEPVDVNTVLRVCQKQTLVWASEDHPVKGGVRSWGMNMAIYSLNSNRPEADYEISQEVLEPGIIKSMILDYGSFKVSAVVNKIDVFS